MPLSYTSVSRSSAPSSCSSPRPVGLGTKRASIDGVTVTSKPARHRPQSCGTVAASDPWTKTASPSFSTASDTSSSIQVAILKRVIERLGAVDPQAFLGDIRYSNPHVLSALTFYIY